MSSEDNRSASLKPIVARRHSEVRFRNLSYVKYLIYDFGKQLLPGSTYRRLGRSRLLKLFRDSWFRRGHVPEIVGDEIEFEDRRFFFAASFQVFSRAKARGLERRLCRLILTYCQDGDVCVDIGANYGFLTSVMACSVGKRGKVIAFEPVPHIFEVLEKTVAVNGFGNVIPFRAAVGAIDGAQLVLDQHDKTSLQAAMVTVDTIVALQKLKRVDLIKVDVDGGDWEVLLGAQKTLARFHPILIVEMSANQDLIYQMVKELGYEYIYDMHGGQIMPDDWPPNLIAAMKEIVIPPAGKTKVNAAGTSGHFGA